MRLLVLLCAVLTTTSCVDKQSRLERDITKLNAGMDRKAVRLVFSDCRILFETNEVERIEVPNKTFETNLISHAKIYVVNKSYLRWDSCGIYFDESDRIIGFDYTKGR